MPHFEIHASDMDTAKAFYAGLFGWRFEPLTDYATVDYHWIEGREIGLDHALSGGIMRRLGAAPSEGSPVRGGTMTFPVADCDTSYRWALANGGAEALPPSNYPGVGRVAYVEDGQGNIVGMMTPTRGGM
ncbi:MAG: VOC family protein [Pseudomonadota bacterium]